jgi:protease-4
MRRLFGGLWRLVDGTRRFVFNLIFLLIVVVLLAGLFRGGAPKLEDKTALVLALNGPLVEQRSGSARDSLLAQARGGEMAQQVQLRDVLSALDAAARDPKITHVLLVLDDFQGGGLAALRDVSAALARFKATGKAVVAWGSNYNQRQYYLAAQANEVLMHPMGTVLVDGFGRYRNYYRDALDKLGISVDLLRVGNYKDAGEPFVANGPSPASAEAEKQLIDGLWGTYTADVDKARGWQPGTLQRQIDALPGSLVAQGGDAAKLALVSKQVDALVTRDEMRERMIQRGAADASDPKRPTFRQVAYTDYLAGLKPKAAEGGAVGVVVAAGEITDGNEPAGRVGGRSTAELIRRARNDEQIKAVVLRVDSPGGSPFGSELVRRELELTRAAGKPVVVSMANLAASGGYWISLAADEMIADAATITGSIGVFALLPNGAKALDKLGVHTAGQPSTWLAGQGDPRRPLDPRYAQLVQASIDHVYADFTQLAAKARKTTPDKIDAVAQGRVWTGVQARQRGLVDRVGGYAEAIAAAAARAKLPADPAVRYIEPEPSRFERFSALLGGVVTQALAEHAGLALVPIGLPTQALREVGADLAWLGGLADGQRGHAAIVHCLCTPP